MSWATDTEEPTQGWPIDGPQQTDLGSNSNGAWAGVGQGNAGSQGEASHSGVNDSGDEGFTTRSHEPWMSDEGHATGHSQKTTSTTAHAVEPAQTNSGHPSGSTTAASAQSSSALAGEHTPKASDAVDGSIHTSSDPAPVSSSASKSAQSSKGPSAEAIAGSIVGGVLAIAVICALIFLLLRRRRRKRPSPLSRGSLSEPFVVDDPGDDWGSESAAHDPIVSPTSPKTYSMEQIRVLERWREQQSPIVSYSDDIEKRYSLDLAEKHHMSASHSAPQPPRKERGERLRVPASTAAREPAAPKEGPEKRWRSLGNLKRLPSIALSTSSRVDRTESEDDRGHKLSSVALSGYTDSGDGRGNSRLPSIAGSESSDEDTDVRSPDSKNERSKSTPRKASRRTRR